MAEVDERPPVRIMRRERAMIELAAELVAERIAEAWAAQPAPTYEAAAPLTPLGLSAPDQKLIAGPPGGGLVDSVYTVSGGHALWPLSVFCTLTTSVAAADRTVALEFRTGSGVRYLVAGTQAVVTAGLTQAFCWHPQAGEVAWPIEDAALAPLPQQHIYPGNALALKVWNGQAGDVLSGVLISARLDPLAES